MSRFQVKGFPWASGIGTDVRECTTSREVMEKAGLDFSVDKCELVARMPFSLRGSNDISETMGDFTYGGNVYRECPNAYATYRTDKNIPLGLVKSKYEVIQNVDAFKFFDDAIGPDKAVWQTAGAFGFGHKVFISAKLPIETTVNGDKIDNYLVFSNSHDGSSSINVMFTPIRVICTNMLNGALINNDNYIRIRHTQSAKEKLQTGAEILRVACEYATSAQELYRSLTTIKLSDEEVMAYLAKLVLSDKEVESLIQFDDKNGFKKLLCRDYLTMERTGISMRKANKIINMFDYYLSGIGQEHIRGNAWGAYNAVTGYYSNVDNVNGTKRMDSLLYGGANRNMLTALNEVIELKAA